MVKISDEGAKTNCYLSCLSGLYVFSSNVISSFFSDSLANELSGTIIANSLSRNIYNLARIEDAYQQGKLQFFAQSLALEE